MGVRICSAPPFRFSPPSSRAADAYDLWGKGVHPARLNLGDCFAYGLAMERGCALPFVGDNFSQTDVQSALSSSEG